MPDALAHLFLICKSPSLNDLIDHLDHYARLVGIDHICLGWIITKAPSLSQEIQTPETMCQWVPALKSRGYADTDIRKILGENLLRYYRETW